MKNVIQKTAAAVLCLLILLGTSPLAEAFFSEANAEPIFVEEAEEVPVFEEETESPVPETEAAPPPFEEGEAVPVSRNKTEKKTDADLDFSSMRLLVKSRDAGLFGDCKEALASYDDLFLLQYDSEEEMQKAYAFYLEKADAVEADSEMTIAETAEEMFYNDRVMTQEDNPLAELAEVVSQSDPEAYDIALIDTGLDDAADAVSVIGEEAGDDHGHGTLVARCMREQNPDAKILSIKALDENGQGSVSSVYAAFEYIKTQNVKIINLSMAARDAEESTILKEAIDEAVSRGITVIGAAGNQAKDVSGFLPGCVKPACIVGAARKDGARNPISNFGETVDYYVAADSTSEAAGTLSGWRSLHRRREIGEVLNQGLIFAPEYVEKKTKVELKKTAESEAKPEGRPQKETEREPVFSAAAERFNRNSVTSKKWKEIKPNVDRWIQRNIPYRSPCSGLIDWKRETAYGLDCSGFVNAMVHLYYDDGRIFYDWAGTWFASSVWAGGLEAAGLKILKGATKKAFSDACAKGTVRAGDIIVFSNASKRGVHVAIVYGTNKAGEALLAHAYGAKLQTTTFNNVYDWDFPVTGSGTYSYYEVFRGTAPDEKEAKLTVTKKVSESNPQLLVKNTVKGNAADAGQRFSFSVVYTPAGSKKAVTESFFLKDGEEKKLSCKPGTAYKVTEAPCEKDGYTTTPASRTCAGVMPSNPNPKRKFSFTVRYVKPGKKKTTTETFRLAGGGKKTFFVKPKSKYVVTEADPPGKWKNTGDAKQSGRAGAAGKAVRVVCKNKYMHSAVKLSFVNQRSAGSLFLEKHCSDAILSEGNRCYSLEGAKYAVYKKDASCSSEEAVRQKAQPGGTGCDAGLSSFAVQDDRRAGTFLVDAKGRARMIKPDGSGTGDDYLSLTAGDYYVVETAPSLNYETDPKVETVTIKEAETVRLSREGTPAAAAGIEIEQKNANSEYTRNSSLSGTQFTVRYFDNQEGDTGGTAKRTWVLNVKEETKPKTAESERSAGRFFARLKPEYLDEARSDAFYSDAKTNLPVLPVGTISVEETRTAAGYTKTNARLLDVQGNEVSLSDGKYIGIVRLEKDGAHLEGGNLYTMLNTPVEIHTDAVYQKSGEHYVKASDYQGAEAAPVTIQDTVTLNGTDAELPADVIGDKKPLQWKLKGTLRDTIGGSVICAAETEPFTPETFQGTQKSLTFEVPDAARFKGHILYVAEELYSVDGETETLAACEDEMLFGDVMDEAEKEKQRIHFPNVQAELVTEANMHETGACKTLTFTDRISFSALIAGRSYTVKGILMEEASGKELLDDCGKKIIAEKTFTAEAPDGALNLSFSFPAVTAAGKKAVAFERIYEDGEEIANHTEIHGNAQTVAVLATELETTLLNTEDRSHDLKGGKTAHLSDQVRIENAVPGADYELTGTIMDRASKKPLAGPDGETYTKTIKPDLKETNGTAEMTFDVAPDCFREGATLVAFEELYYIDPETERRVLVSEHRDLEDENQTVRLPSVVTRLSLSSTSKEVQSSGEIDLQDEVELDNLKPGEKYTVRGCLVNKETGNYLKKDGSETKKKENAYSGTYSFRAGETRETVQVPFALNARGIDFDIVCFEELSMLKTASNGRQTVETVAVHADLKNASQTVHFSNPKTGDTAHLWRWILAGLGGLVLLFIIVRAFRKEKK